MRLKLIVNYQTFLVIGLAILSTHICVLLNLKADFPLTLIGTAVIFPIVFSIGGAYKRRESTLNEYGVLKGLSRSLYYAGRDWLPADSKFDEEKFKAGLLELFMSFRKLFHDDLENLEQDEKEVYSAFSRLSVLINEYREFGMPGGEVSRCNSFFSKMMVSFEKIKHVYQYRTPLTLRVYSKTFIILLPILYGPFFAHEYTSYTKGIGYIFPVLLALILVSLDNIQDHLENPFDLVGEDDVNINAEKFIANLDCV